MSIATSVPTIKQGQYLTFKNLDAPLDNGIWHTITACRAPCDGKTGIAFPLAERVDPIRLRRARHRRRARFGYRHVVDPDQPPAGDLHLLLPDPPVHAGCVPRRRQLTRCCARSRR